MNTQPSIKLGIYRHYKGVKCGAKKLDEPSNNTDSLVTSTQPTDKGLEHGAKIIGQALTQQDISLPITNPQTKPDQLFQADLPSTNFSSLAPHEYRVFGTALHSDYPICFVIYGKDGIEWARPYLDFFDIVVVNGKEIRRFEFVSE